MTTHTQKASMAVSDETMRAFRHVLEEVELTERSNTRNAGTDYFARVFFRDHGRALLDIVEAARLRTITQPQADEVTEAEVERVSRRVAGKLLDHEFEGDAESEWGRIAPFVRDVLLAALQAKSQPEGGE